MINRFTKKGNSTSLSSFQQDSIARALQELEESLWEIDRLALGVEEDRVLYRRALKLTPDQRLIVRGVVATTLSQIGELKEILGLKAREDDPARTISKQMILHSNNLRNRHSKSLSTFGKIDPAMAETLDHYIEHLALLSLGLAELVGSNEW